jgi:ribose transport system substrate-binding protein
MRQWLSRRQLRDAFLIGLLISAAGCQPSTPPGAGAGTAAKKSTPLKLAAVLPMFSHPFFVAQKAGLEAEARALGVDLDVRDGQDDDQKQIVQVETLIAQGVDAIILCSRDEQALVPAVESANRANIPMITLNRRVQGGRVVAYVGADDADGGREQANELVKRLGPKGGKIIYLQGAQGATPQISRGKGFRAVLSQHAEITIADERFADFQADKAKSVMTGVVQRFQPGQIQAIVAQNDEMALPAAEVARAAGWTDVIVIGFDGTKDAFAAIKDGRLSATILQDAAEQGRLAVRTAVSHLEGQKTRLEILTPLPIVTKENVHQFKPSY